ncbi:putative transcription factor aatf che-1 protein [Neofusicoccum parvum UCRNP2]|uniref:Protein BFR2 n=2 Tax=Neofusicoccum parvum TaxID=310453 RepID=R1ERT9_BOTPV|nr:putative transcription factor aatf che-1 protein [Neofusicoccum parvum UCRNP2]GME44152.1 TRAUB domain-containing protein [Neofusicoccum parvum]
MAKGKRAKTLAEQLADLDGPVPADFDPEEPDNYNSDSEESGSDEDNANDGREHYVEVGKSKLRKRDTVPLGPRYEGSRVSRDAVEDEDSDDPFSRGFDEGSSDEDDDEGESGVSDENEEEDIEGSGSDDDEDGTSATDLSDEDDEDEDMEDAGPKSGIDRAELRKIMSEEQKTVAATISEAAKADAEKGRAVKTQRKTFDALLNTRIRLQKALISTNSMSSPKVQIPDDETNLSDPVRAAEEAACNLWNSLNDLRESLHTARTGEKRKRVEISTTTPAQEAWNHMQSYESTTLPHRQSVLEKWSSKARGVSAMPSKGRLTNTTQQTIVDVLSSQLADPTRLVQKTRTARSCAPLQTGTESVEIFDDADFYGLLLKELLERRSEESQTGALAGMSFNNVPITSHWQAAREAKTKRANVDVRASKGRKLRYTVHEKLQNFMAPEDRNMWVDRQADELFSSLFGQRNGLAEDDVDEERDSGEEDLGDQGLLLFGGKK